MSDCTDVAFSYIDRVFLLEEYGGRAQSSSVSPRGGGYCSSASTPHSSNGGSYGGGTGPGSAGGGAMNGYGGTTPTSAAQLGNMLPGSPSSGLFNSASSKRTPLEITPALLRPCSYNFG